MRHEGIEIHGGDSMAVASRESLLEKHEQFYVPASMKDHDVFCGDEREGGEDTVLYLNLFGGGTNISYTLTVLRELVHPGSVTEGFDILVSSQAPTIMRTGGLHYGVHSDDHTELGMKLDINDPKITGIGCGYLRLRKDISELIAGRTDDILAIGQREIPELFTTAEDIASAHDIMAAHGRLATRPRFLPDGRAVAKAAICKGAKCMVVRGQHVGELAFINDSENSTLDTVQAIRNGQPAYNHDAWVAKQTLTNLHSLLFPYSSLQVSMRANHIDTIGTALALGVAPENIIRRS